ncbi:hypothetical protein [Streptomyces werraensis]|uniref:hypothetical protein n=1 Tax=Streptomyces werraensis TaxID=68284 RepID=UPI003439B962
MSGIEKTREEWLKEQYPALFDTTREAKLPVWAQFKLDDLRELLLAEAADNDGLRADIERQSETIDHLRRGSA